MDRFITYSNLIRYTADVSIIINEDDKKNKI